MHFHGLWVLPLFPENAGDVVLCPCCACVVLDFDLERQIDLERLVVVLQCLRILALFLKDRADAAQQ